MEYIRLCNDVVDRGKLVPREEFHSHLESNDISYYRSLFFYNEEQFKLFKEKGSIAGIKDVIGNYIVFDFDSESDIEASRHDALELCTRLISYGLSETDFNVFFSGNKGYSVEFYITDRLTPQEFKNLTGKLSEGLKTRDEKIVNASRVFRVPLSRHPKSGLYKLSLSFNQLGELNSNQIKDLAKNWENASDFTENELILPKALKDLITSDYKVESEYNPELGALDLSRKPRNMPACKFAIMHGFIKPGTTHDSLMALGAHFKSIGYPKEATYRILKAAVELQERRYPERDGQAPKDSIWKITDEVYEKLTDGGTYSCKSHDFLKKNCPSLTSPDCKANGDLKTNSVRIESIADSFAKYASDIDKNTVKTGIKCVDEQIRLQTCSHVVLAGCSGSGKTTFILNILNNLSKDNLFGLFGSMDMNANLIYQKLAHRVSGLDDKQLYDLYKINKRDTIDLIKYKIKNNFNNILFDFRSGVSFEELRENVLETKHKVGSNMKLVVLDFINRIRGPYSDETANLAYIAPKLSDLANESETLIISLAQIARHKGGPSTPLVDSRIAKGSSAIEESATVLFGIWRPGYNMGINDKYMCISALKTRMGKEFQESLYFNGLTSEIRDLTGDEQIQYEHFIDSLEKNNKKDDDWGQ